MKQFKFAVFVVLIGIIFNGCRKDDHRSNDPDPKGGSLPGVIYTLSNQEEANKLLVFARAPKGKLTFLASYNTGGTGTGTGLSNQGAIALSDNSKWLLVVNPGSNTISSFSLSLAGLQKVSTVSSGGNMPVSITIHKKLVYVVNAGDNNNISGFTLSDGGVLTPLAGSSKPLNAQNAGPAQISFVAGGAVLVITERMTNTITSFAVNSDGLPGMMHTLTSANPTPFGFAVGESGVIYISEAAGGMPGASTVSSYKVQSDGVVSLLDGPNAAGQTAACWVVAVNSDKYVYATNTGSGNISSFKTDHGELNVLEATAGITGIGSSPSDVALNHNSKFLYALLSGTESIAAFEVKGDGSLRWIQTINGLPDGATGLVAQ